MTRILVTGASGLLGTEICQQLSKTSKIWAVDNHFRSTSVPECEHWQKLDLANANEVAQLPTDFDYIYHYGAINGTSNFYQHPNLVLSNNIQGDLNIFEHAQRCPNLKKIVYASSSEIVSDDPMSPVSEHTDITIKNIHNARWSYRLAKVCAENYLTNSKLPYVILRYFNVYGQGSKAGHFLADQIAKIQQGKFEIIGPNETRSFCYVEDAIQASIYCALNINNEVINIGNDQEITIAMAAQIIANALGHSSPEWIMLPSLPGSTATRKPNITKLKNIMPEYLPRSFEQGINKIFKNT